MTRMWTIYKNPKDFPGQYVAREFLVTPTGAVPQKRPLAVHENLETIRSAIRWYFPLATCLGRQPTDDPVIVETWI